MNSVIVEIKGQSPLIGRDWYAKCPSPEFHCKTEFSTFDRCSRVTLSAHATLAPLAGFSSITHNAPIAIDSFSPHQALPTHKHWTYLFSLGDGQLII